MNTRNMFSILLDFRTDFKLISRVINKFDKY